ncbi:MAG: hypothetical protein RBS96_08340, partial [Dehalococcoidales bacterium]|nr:hypothetical protein [Dehalococcoidales bacterium]
DLLGLFRLRILKNQKIGQLEPLPFLRISVDHRQQVADPRRAVLDALWEERFFLVENHPFGQFRFRYGFFQFGNRPPQRQG